jgi:hypothetical protein
MEKAEARNVYADDLCKLAHRCLQREDGKIKGFDMRMFESLSEIIIKASNESYASLREAQLKRENMALRSFLLSMSEGSAYLEKKVELLFKTLEPPDHENR